MLFFVLVFARGRGWRQRPPRYTTPGRRKGKRGRRFLRVWSEFRSHKTPSRVFRHTCTYEANQDDQTSRREMESHVMHGPYHYVVGPRRWRGAPARPAAGTRTIAHERRFRHRHNKHQNQSRREETTPPRAPHALEGRAAHAFVSHAYASRVHVHGPKADGSFLGPFEGKEGARTKQSQHQRTATGKGKGRRLGGRGPSWR